jgi:hypothetical protein
VCVCCVQKLGTDYFVIKLCTSGMTCRYGTFWAVFQIRDILVQIRIPRSYHRLTDPDSDPALFISDLQDANKNFLLRIFFEDTFTERKS